MSPAVDTQGVGEIVAAQVATGTSPQHFERHSMNFFHWLREGVRHAVVLGIADACDDIGQHAKGDDFGPALAASLREKLAAESSPAAALPGRAVDASSTGRTRKRLGRSLANPDETLKRAA